MDKILLKDIFLNDLRSIPVVIFDLQQVEIKMKNSPCELDLYSENPVGPGGKMLPHAFLSNRRNLYILVIVRRLQFYSPDEC